MKNNTHLRLLVVLGMVSLLACGPRIQAQSIQKQRVIILSDIEADPDDTESFVRLMLYSNEIDLKGLIATTSCWQKNRVAPESIKRIVEGYRKVQPNLKLHSPDYPLANAILSVVKQGLPAYGMLGVGEGKDSEGSDWIIKILKEEDERPLWISVWGGANTLAQALFTIKKTMSKAEADRLIAKLRVYTISDQDDSGIWIRNNFPDLFYVVSPGDDYGTATWSAINSFIQGIGNETISNPWLEQNIQLGHGPLGALYPDVSWGMEGDTPSWLLLINNGLNEPEHPDWGSWGGRYELYKPATAPLTKGESGVPSEPETRAIWTNGADTYVPYVPNDYGRNFKTDTVSFSDNKVSLWRWRDDFQHDFAARMDWCTKPYTEANHPPVPVLTTPGQITVKSGEGFGLDAFNSYDPDGDHISYLWFCYPEAGTYKKPIKIEGADNSHGAYAIAPVVHEKVTAQFILKVTDHGSPSLSRYKRVIVTILPE